MKTLSRIVAGVLMLPSLGAAQQIAAPDDWTWRLDRPQALASGRDLKPGEWNYQRMPPGWHVTTTDQGATLYPKAHTVTGRWGVEMELFLFPNPSESGLGFALDGGAGAPELRLLLRGDGSASAVSIDGGQEKVLAGWTRDTSVAAHNGKDVTKYVLRVSHEAGMLAFAVNGTRLFTVPGGGSERSVVPGVRVGPGLNLHVSRFDLVTPLAPVPVRKS